MNKNDIKVIFMGTPKIASEILKALINDGYNICLVVTNGDKKVGRKGILTPSEVKKVAIENNIEVFQPTKIRNDFKRIQEIKADILITCAYGQIVPQEVLDAPRLGCINVHGSLLPLLRGASPIQSALIQGFNETGVTIMEMIDKMDAGRMYAKKSVIIDEKDNYTSLYEKITNAGKECLLEMLPSYIDGTNKGIEQNDDDATYCSKITSDFEHLSLNDDNETFINKVKGLSYTPGGYVFIGDKKLKILECKNYSDDIETDVGKFIKKSKSVLVLQLAFGQVEVLKLQKESKNIVDSKSFMNGERNLESLIVN